MSIGNSENILANTLAKILLPDMFSSPRTILLFCYCFYKNFEISDKINKIFDTDDGARFVGEFALGVNPYVTKPMCDILFDEKISGSIHFTPGACYDDAWNGNESAIHWDLVLDQTKEHGGGEIYFDDVLIRKDGLFALDELKCLNPENLK